MLILLAKAALSVLESSTIFPFLFFLSIGWYCGAGVFGLIGCISLSLNLSLPTFFNNNSNSNNNNNNMDGYWCVYLPTYHLPHY